MTAIMSSTDERVADADGGGGGGEKAIECISALSIPRRNSTKQAQVRVSHTRTSVPCTDAEASSAPELFIVRQARRFSWAVMSEIFVGRFWWCWGGSWPEVDNVGGVKSTS